MATHSSILAWKIPWIVEPGRLQSMGSQRVGRDRVTWLHFIVALKYYVSSRVWLFATPWTVARQAPLFMRFSRQEYWCGLPFPSLGDLPDPGIESMSPAGQTDSLPLSHLGRPIIPCAIGKSLLLICFTHSSLYLLILLIYPSSPSLSPLVTIRLFCMSVTLFCI